MDHEEDLCLPKDKSRKKEITEQGTLGLRGEVWMEVSEGLQWEGHSYSKAQ